MVDQLGEGLLLVDGLQDHLMLTLLAHFLDGWGIDVLAVCHRGDLDTAVCDALGGDEFLVQLAGHPRLDCGLHYWPHLPELSVDVEVLRLDDMVLLSLEHLLLVQLLQVDLLLHVQRHSELSYHVRALHVVPGLLRGACELLGLVHGRLLEVVLRLEGHNRVVLVGIHLSLVCCTAPRALLGVAVEHALAFFGVLLGPVDPLGHPHEHLFAWRLPRVGLEVLDSGPGLVV